MTKLPMVMPPMKRKPCDGSICGLVAATKAVAPPAQPNKADLRLQARRGCREDNTGK